MARLYLVRHATHALLGKALAGRMSGVALSDEGQAQARALASHFAGADVATVLSSPLERCRQTAAPIAERLGLGVETHPALDEIDCGEWTGQSFEALSDDPRWRAWNAERGRAVVPGGEAVAEVESRIMALIATLADADRGPALFVTHSDVVKVAMLSLLRAPLDLHDRLEIEPASITTVDLWRGGGKIVRSNQTVPA